jgi:defect-in-organelle-trafficking protein DotD
MIAIDWYGPIQGLLEQIAASTGYQLEVFGKPPTLPVLVNINTTTSPESAINIIRDADLQGGLKVAVIVMTEQKIISLRYLTS